MSRTYMQFFVLLSQLINNNNLVTPKLKVAIIEDYKI
ncbi:MAG: hypothetical protein ACI85O_003292 [Saprospiraceae bacterium]|jgi:hypothetical protein